MVANLKLCDIDVIRLLELLKKSKGNIFLVTEDGNKLNLKSRLCQLYGVRTLLEKTKNSTASAELSVENPEDELMFINYMMSK